MLDSLPLFKRKALSFNYRDISLYNDEPMVKYNYSQEQDSKTHTTEYMRLLRVAILSVKYSMPDVSQSSINRL